MTFRGQAEWGKFLNTFYKETRRNGKSQKNSEEISNRVYPNNEDGEEEW